MKLVGNWSYPTAIRFGAGRVSELADACKAAGMERPLLVTDRGLASMEITARALDILEARDNWTRPEIRKQYKSLVKDLHPDMNGGNRDDEERLQEVVWAWDQIKESRNFRD